jgi:hypothetical protein
MKTREFLSNVFSLAWQLVKRNGFSMCEALKVAGAKAKRHLAMKKRIVKVYCQ